VRPHRHRVASRACVGPGLAALACVAVGLACAEQDVAPQPAAAPTPRAALVLEPSQIGVGQVAKVALTVTSPPDFVPRPFAAPDELPGLWLLGVERLPVEKQASRWIHRSHLRLRAREVGSFTFPGGAVELEGPDGELSRLPFEPLAVEVVSVVPEYPGRTTPFGPRSAPRSARPGAVWGPALGGALAALAAVGLVALQRRRRRQQTRRVAPVPPAPEPPWTLALEELARARALGRTEPFNAAHATALGLRRYVERRFRTPAAGLTSEELGEATPPFAATSRWPAFVAILRSLDGLRFRPEGDPTTRDVLAGRLQDVLAEAEAFVEDSIPPEARR
jgi:hypothetical protein